MSEVSQAAVELQQQQQQRWQKQLTSSVQSGPYETHQSGVERFILAAPQCTWAS